MKKVAECLYLNESSKTYFALVKRSGKQIRRSLKTQDRKLAERRLRDFRDQISELSSEPGDRRIKFKSLSQRWLTISNVGLKPPSAKRNLVIGSVARSAFVIQSTSNDPEDDRVVVTCCKNNDGDLGERTAWHRRNGLFEAVQDFDWSGFDKEPETTIATTQDKVLSVLREGQSTRKDLVEELKHRFGMGKSSVYNAINSILGNGLATEELDGSIVLK